MEIQAIEIILLPVTILVAVFALIVIPIINKSEKNRRRNSIRFNLLLFEIADGKTELIPEAKKLARRRKRRKQSLEKVLGKLERRN
ncbi:MAG: hypothetical protein ACOCUR_01750 [Nanoarchaeota archaeon]